MKLEEAVAKVKEGRKRGFVQSYDLIINLKGIDLNKPENHIVKDVALPNKVRTAKVCIISDSHKGENVVGKAFVEELANDKKKAKLFAKTHDAFICEAPLMLLVGKVLGRYLGPKGKMPKPVPPGSNLAALVEDASRTVRIIVRTSLTVRVVVGKEDMENENVLENAEKVVSEVIKALPKGKGQIKNIMLKLTMGSPVKIDV